MTWGPTETIQWVEVLWTLIAIPGLIRWWTNRLKAGRYVTALKTTGEKNGRMVFAKYTVRKTNAFVVIELIFVAIGLLTMTAPVNESAHPLLPGLYAAGFIVASLYIALLGRAWAQVDEYILRQARERELEARERGQSE